MKVLLTTVSLDAQRGAGTTERTRQLARHLVRAGHECIVAAIDSGSREAELRELGIQVHVCGFIRLRVSIPFILPKRLLALVRKADAIHLLGYWNMLSVATALCARAVGKPYVLSAAGEFAALARPRPIARLFHRLLGLGMIRHAALLVAITELERQQIIERFGIAAARVVVLPNGVEVLPAAAEAERTTGGEEAPAVLFVGRLASIKGPDLLLDAFARVCGHHPGVRLVLAGPDFGLEAQLRARSAELGIEERVAFVGHVEEVARTILYRRALFLAVPSRAEAMSLVALEAGAVATPVLVTDQCGLEEVRTIGAGAVCPADVESLACAIDELLRADDLIERGRRWRDHVLQNYAWPAITERLVETLRKLS